MAGESSLSAAIAAHQAGQLEQAGRLYQDILAAKKDDADAMHLLGVLHHQQRDHAKAVELIGQAVALRPSVPAFHANLAECYRALGQFERAEGSCRMALRLRPDYPEALCNLGLALQGLKRHDAAVGHFQRALELRPGFAAAHNNLGISLRELKRFDEALEHFHKAVGADPTFAPARTNLGQLLLDRGRAGEALGHALEAVRLQPDRAALHHNLGNVFRALDKTLEARTAYLEALRLDPNLAQACVHLGLLLQQEGQFSDALPWLKQAVELEPDNAAFHQHLGEFYEEWEEPALAIPCFEKVLALDPSLVDARLALGWAMQEENRIVEAEGHYRKVLETRPAHAMAHFNLGGLHELLGKMVDAEKSFRDALRLQPDFALPHAKLATLLRDKLTEADRSALERRLADVELAPRFRCRLLFALAQVLDGTGDFARAAECLRESNRMALEAAKGWQVYDPAEHAEFVDALQAAFMPALFERTSGSGLESRRPVFVFGLPRSGTTLVEQILSGHSQVHGAGELRLARQTFERVPQALGVTASPRACVADLTAAAVRSLGQSHLDELTRIADSASARIADKMPENYLYLGLLAVLFPRATFIHCRRDLRDVAVSCWMTDFRNIRWANAFEHIASRFRQYRRLTDHWSQVVPVPVHTVHYEDTVSDLEGVARRLTAACGLEFEPACLEFHTVRRPVHTASVAQVRQPVYKKSVARWKHYEAELGELFAMLPEN